jgi:MATH domain
MRLLSCNAVWFAVQGRKWRLTFHYLGTSKKSHASVFLELLNADELAPTISREVTFQMAIMNRNLQKCLVRDTLTHDFETEAEDWGYPEFAPQIDLVKDQNGYLDSKKRLRIAVCIEDVHTDAPAASGDAEQLTVCQCSPFCMQSQVVKHLHCLPTYM